MYMPLVASEDGIVQFVKQPGVSLEPGDILGILTLDDPARVKHAKPFEGLLPALGSPSVIGNKPHQRMNYYLGVLNDILDGFDNQAVMAATLKDLLNVLSNPELPFSQSTATLSSLSGRMPVKLEDTIRAAIDSARAKSENAEFPAQRIKKALDHFMQDNIRSQDRAMFRTQLQSLFDVVEQYQNSLKAHELDTIAGLLGRFVDTEKLFGGSIEAKVLTLREQHKDDLDTVVGLVLSHIMAHRKGKLVMTILDHVKQSGLTVSNPDSKLYQVLQGLASLEARYVPVYAFKVSIRPHTSLSGLRRKSRSRRVKCSSRVRCLRMRNAKVKWRVSSRRLSIPAITANRVVLARSEFIFCLHIPLRLKHILGLRLPMFCGSSSTRDTRSTTSCRHSSTTTTHGSALVRLTLPHFDVSC